jgi:N-acetylglucosaminyldiphosphoundecaprenol N-acetyl-beta-D-mannosaminyltransferase
MPPGPEPRRVEIAGLRVSAIAMPDALAAIEGWIARRDRHFVCVTGVHGVIESRSDPELRAIHDRAGLVTPDGMPLVWMARRLGHPATRRVYGPDLMRILTELSARRGYRQYYFGGGPGLAERLRDTLLARFPNLRVAGLQSPPFGAVPAEEDEAMVAAINAAEPDIVWVGLSTPKQEYWMDRHRARIDAPVLIGVGAAFDFLAGTKRQAPRWMQRSGLEWLFRLAAEPRRLWRRYGLIVPRFLVLAGGQLLREARARRRLPPRAGMPQR